MDINGEVVVQYYYDAYGNITNIDYEAGYSTVANINPYRYKGYRYDSEINMYYLNSRYYNPEISRFINADGLLGEIGNIQSTNMYAYCANNPVMYSDISGEFPILAILAVTAIVGLGLTIAGVASDNNTMTAIGLTMVAIPALITGGLAAFATTATLTNIIGGVTIAAGLGTATFASAEWQQTFTGDNWILNTGMSEKLYNGLMIGVASLATLGTAASSFSYSFRINSIQNFGKYGDYYGMRFDTAAGKTRVLSFHTHGHGAGFSQWHWQLQKYNPYTDKAASTIGRWVWWKLWQMG